MLVRARTDRVAAADPYPTAYDGAQPNDPVEAAQAIPRAVDDDTSPLRLPLGPEAVTLIRGHLGEIGGRCRLKGR
jgi:hypothetical protein